MKDESLTKEQQELIWEHKNLIKSVANKLICKTQSYTYEDIYQVGFLGLMKAAKTFDNTRGCSFKTYAYQMITHAIVDDLRLYDRLIYIPYQTRKLCKDFKEKRKETGIKLEEYSTSSSLSLHLLKQALFAMQPIISLDEPQTYDDEFFTLMDLLSDNGKTIEIGLMSDEVKDEIRFIIDDLSNRGISEKHVDMLKAYFGIDEKAKTYEEIGRKYDLSRARVQQIVKRLLIKIKHTYPNLRDQLDTCNEYELM